jgi:hypothetical protein
LTPWKVVIKEAEEIKRENKCEENGTKAERKEKRERPRWNVFFLDVPVLQT